MSIKVLHRMTLLKKFARLPQVAAYNRDWYRYLPLPGSGNNETEEFRLRNGQVVEVKRDARFILNEIYLDRVYDLPGVPYSCLTHILDLGANIGLYATYVASLNPHATLHCFEPAKSNYEILERNIRRNRVNARLYESAVSVNTGVGFLSHKGSSVEYALVDSADEVTEEVQCVALDSVFERCGVARFDLLKIDIEGHEKSLIEGASDDWFRRFDHLIMEWHYSQAELEVVAERLRLIGFEAEPVLIQGHMQFLRASLTQR
jgi:FkbM family methyltransferase